MGVYVRGVASLLAAGLVGCIVSDVRPKMESKRMVLCLSPPFSGSAILELGDLREDVPLGCEPKAVLLLTARLRPKAWSNFEFFSSPTAARQDHIFILSTLNVYKCSGKGSMIRTLFVLAPSRNDSGLRGPK